MTRSSDLEQQLEAPDQHLDPAVAAGYDRAAGARFSPEELQRTADVLVELADDGPVVEFAIGTGRVALALAARGVAVSGMDISESMLAELHQKPGSEAIETMVGDRPRAEASSWIVHADVVAYSTRRGPSSVTGAMRVRLGPAATTTRRHPSLQVPGDRELLAERRTWRRVEP